VIRVEALTFAVGDFQLDGLTLDVARGEYFALLGPPGSGKTVFLECLCGLNTTMSGRILIDGRDVTRLEPRKREIGYVPQDYALFTHLTVRQNVGFGLRRRGLSRREADRKVEEKASLLGIGHLLTRRIAGLSGGEQQRVALARALAVEPKVLLLDEPVSSLDESTRDAVCRELGQLQRELGMTTMHITHNLEEAFSVADRGGVLHNGAFEQIGALGELMRHPTSEFAARFMRCANLLRGRAGRSVNGTDSTCIEVNGVEFMVPGRHSGNVTFMIRPESICLSPSGSLGRSATVSRIPITLARSVDRGTYVRLDLDGPVPLIGHMSHGSVADLRAFGADAELLATVQQEAIHVIPGDVSPAPLLEMAH